MIKNYDVIVVGSGHAGVEASYAAARLGCRVLILTVSWDQTAQMSCNPSIGGLGKGHIVKEIDILGGLMAIAADRACIQFKKLNRSKGPAVRGSRTQCDKKIYRQFVQNFLCHKKSSHAVSKNISYLSCEVKSLIFKGDTCCGVKTHTGEQFNSQVVILTTGTFMKAIMHIGSTRRSGGRMGEKATWGLSDQLKSLNFPVHRLKTGTPPRLKKTTIDFQPLCAQQGDAIFYPFSFFSSPHLSLPQQLCYLTYTNEKTHDIIRKNLKKSPLYTGAIQAKGPRYCPSVEDKITCFPDKTQHQSFLEPETIGGESIYLQGLSTSLPVDVQIQFLRTIKGLSRVEILKPGYAVEYDFFDPQILLPNLETKPIKNLFFAGQINGSSGYEEAAGQGLIAGINASLKVKGEDPLILKRSEAYIGVLIDDLVTKGTQEPYRMLTSRAEHRLVLREDNVIERLFHLSQKYRLVPEWKLKKMENELNQRAQLFWDLKNISLVPNRQNQILVKKLNASPLLKPQTLKDLLKRPEMSAQKIKNFISKDSPFKLSSHFSLSTWESVEIKIKYEGYIQRQNKWIAQNSKMENLIISDVDYDRVKGLSREALEKLKKIQPKTLAQAGRISGLPPVAIQALLIYLQIKNRPSKSLDVS